jgi:hypothetical protein
MTASTQRATSACVVAYLLSGLTIASVVACATTGASAQAFEWRSSEGSDLLLWHDEAAEAVPLLEFIRPAFSRSDVEGTKKPFHHLYSPADGSRLTKGAGGLYPHHRGLFFGYNQIEIEGREAIDVWHAREGEHTVYRRTLERLDGPAVAGHSVAIDWVDREDRIFATEQRSLRVFDVTSKGFLVDVESVLSTELASVLLGGDRQHAGVQFRAAQAVAEAKEDTRFLRPAPWQELAPEVEINDDNHVDLPWNAMIFEIEDQTYTVVYMSAADNPSPAHFSERSYGRFGEFVPFELTPASPLRLRYRLWLVVGRAEVDQITRRYRQFSQQDF